mmetsp:Transcript_17122/g.58122  ORF Transcript_17122/g.58122 Transcript_17122/m.58122 type:complete len:98 (-) Transcript_17122:41-334(-)
MESPGEKETTLTEDSELEMGSGMQSPPFATDGGEWERPIGGSGPTRVRTIIVRVSTAFLTVLCALVFSVAVIGAIVYAAASEDATALGALAGSGDND